MATSAKKTTKKQPAAKEVRYGFPAEATAELTARLVAAGEGARLGVRIVLGKAYLRVAVAGAVALDDPPEINNSFRCPPNTGCP